MIGLLFYFFLGIFFWLTAVYIFLKAEEKAFFFLAGYLLINGFGIITRSLDFNGLMSTYPHVYGILHPLQFLYGPFFLFFLVKMFNQKHFFRKREILHFIPFLFVFIDTIPFCMLAADQKIAIMKLGGNISFFNIPKNVYDGFKGASYALYAFWSIGYYIFYLYSSRIFFDQKARVTHYWFRVDMLLKLIGVISFIYFQAIKQQHTYTFGFYLFSLDSLFNVIVIYCKPSLLGGLAVEKSRNELKLRYAFIYLYRSIKVLFNFSVSDKEIINYLKYYFKVRGIHLNPSTNAEQLAQKLSIRKQRLNELSQSKFKCSLDNFINYKRLETFVYENEVNADLNRLVSGLFKSGFNSVIDFQNTVNSYAGYTHKEFLQITPEEIYAIQQTLTQALSKD